MPVGISTSVMLLYWILLPIVWVLAHIVFRIQVIGRENLKAVRDGRAYVIAPNHIANLDPVLIAITIFDWKRLRILAKEELFKNPLAGWFLRCMGAVNAQKLSILRAADAILQETVAESGLKKPNMRAFVVLTDFAEAFQSDAPRYVLALRVVTGTSEERPHVLRLPQDAAERAAARMLSEVPNVYRVLYDLSPIPPARVEWE